MVNKFHNMETINIKSAVLITLLFCFSIPMYAQFAIGINGGYTNAKEDYGDVILPENAETTVNRFNIHATTYYIIDTYFSVGVEPGYTGRGAACVPGFFIPVFDTKYLLNYAELPILFKGSLPLFKNKIALFGKVGIGTSFLVAAYEEQEDLFGDLPTARMKMPLDNNGVLNRWDYGIYNGAGLSYNLSKSQIYFAFDYYYGLADAEKYNTSKNRSFNFNLGYSIFLK